MINFLFQILQIIINFLIFSMAVTIILLLFFVIVSLVKPAFRTIMITMTVHIMKKLAVTKCDFISISGVRSAGPT